MVLLQRLSGRGKLITAKIAKKDPVHAGSDPDFWIQP
jgi:hypothetical protein